MIDKQIAKNIILAQIASDGGKGFETKTPLFLSSAYTKKGYRAKDNRIMRAIEGINCNKNSGFYYNVKLSHYSNYMKSYCYIIYFNFKINGVKKQISFHSFSCELSKYSSNKTVTRWIKKNDSRDCCLDLAKFLDLK